MGALGMKRTVLDDHGYSLIEVGEHEPRRESRLTRIAYWLAIIAFIGIFLLAWTAVPDCWQTGVCG